jgi:DNA-binding NarL/FixJ family response regulator
MIKILIVDDHSLIRVGLKQVISDVDDIVVAGEAASGQEAYEKVMENDFDVVLLDINMPGENGVETLKRIKSKKPDIDVIMLSVYPEDQYAVRAIKAGASGYLTKDTDMSVMLKAIRKVYEGGRYISPVLAESLAAYVERDTERPLHEKLSDREFQVMRMLTKGKKIKEIAEELYLSESTVTTYKSRIMNKLDIRNDVQLAIYAMKHNLVD